MPINNFGIVDRRNGSLYRSAQPDRCACETLALLGINKVIRLNADENFDPNKENEFISVDYTPIATLSVDIEKSLGIVNKIKEYLDDGKNVLVHCTHGKDRTSFIIGIYRILFNKWTLEQVHAERKTYGVNLLCDVGDWQFTKALEFVFNSKS